MLHDQHVTECRWALLSCISDAYKDLNGVRPHGMFSDQSVTDLFATRDRIYDMVSEDIARERREAEELAARIAAAEAHPKGIVFDTAEEWEREYGYTSVEAYVPTPGFSNNALGELLKEVM